MCSLGLISRSSRWQMFFKIGALKIFTISTGKNLCWSLLLIKLKAFRTATLLKRLQHRYSSVNIVKNIFGRLFQPDSVILGYFLSNQFCNNLGLSFIVWTLPSFLLGWLNLLPNFQKGGGLDRISIFSGGVAGQEGGELFQRRVAVFT